MEPILPQPTTTPRTTEFLVRDARSGNDAAWRELYERYRRMLLVMIECRMQGTLRRRFDAEDVLQEAIYKAWSRIDSFEHRGEGSFRSWLKRIVFHEFQNLIKKQDAERRREAPDAPRTHAEMARILAPVRRPSQVLSEIETKRDVLRKMAELSEEEQELITLRIFEKKDWREIGEIMGYSRVLASQRFDRTIATLARRMD